MSEEVCSMSHILKILVFATGMIPVLPFRILIIQKKVMLRGALSAIFVVSERNEMVMWRGGGGVKTVVDVAHHLAENPAVSRGVGYMVHSDVVVNHFMKKNVLNLIFGEVAIGTDDNNEVSFSFPAPQIPASAVSHHSEIAFGFAQFYWRNVESGIENGFVEQTEFFNKQVNCRNHWVSWQSLLPCRYK